MSNDTSIIVRQDDPRLGQITPRAQHLDEGDLDPRSEALHEQEMIRALDVIQEQSSLNVLPIPKSAEQLRPRKRYIVGVRELARRFGDQVGGAFAAGIYHGTDSASNVLATGGFVDLGSASYHPNHAPLKLLHDAAPGGLLEALSKLSNLFDDSRGGSFNLAPPPSAGDDDPLPSAEEMEKITADAYFHRLSEEFLLMTGLPSNLAATLVETKDGKALADILIRIAEDGGTETMIKDHTPAQVTRYNIRPLIQELATVSGGSVEEIVGVLQKHMENRGGDLSNSGYWRHAAESFQKVMQIAERTASKQGVGNQAFGKLVRLNSKYARERWDLSHFAMGAFSKDVIENYNKDGNKRNVQRAMDQQITENLLKHDAFAWNESVIDFAEKDGLEIFRVYDALSNQEIRVIRAPIRANGKVQIAGKRVDVDAALNSQISLDGQSLKTIAPPRILNRKVEFRVPAAPHEITGAFCRSQLIGK